MSMLRKRAIVATFAGGVVLFFLYAHEYDGGFFFPLFIFTATFGVPGIICMLVSSRLVSTSYKISDRSVGEGKPLEGDPGGPKIGRFVPALGIVLALSSLFIIFPIGCYVASCPADSAGAWATIWPNVLTLGAGLFLTGWGGYARRSPKRSLAGVAIGGISWGVVVLALGLQIGYSTSCLANGCPPLTLGQWWSLFWPDLIADSLGLVLILAGSILLLRWSRSAVNIPTGSQR
jgi:hypothetical protein